MFKSLMMASLMAISSAPVVADSPKVANNTVKEAERLRDVALKSDTAYQLLEDLTTEVGQRLAGTEAEWRAIDWSVKRMEKLGFDKVYIEEFPLTIWERVSEKAVVMGENSQTLEITALGGSVSTPNGGVNADVVAFADLEALKAASEDEVKGKIVFITHRIERFRDGRGYGKGSGIRGKSASLAASKGAKAVMIRSIGTDSHRMPHTGQMSYNPAYPKIAAVALSNPDADQLERMMARGSVKLSLDVNTKSRAGKSANVIGEITGRENPDQFVVLGSHLDSWDLGTGAVDDGAGVTITMAAADLIADFAKKRPRKSIRVVLYGAEEQGLTGAKAYAEKHKNDKDQFVIGAESDFGAGPIYALRGISESGKPAFDAMAKALKPLGIERDENKASGGPDVGQLRRIGVPVADLRQDGTDYFDLHHTPDDTFDKVNPEHMRQNLASWVVFSYIAAEWPGEF